MGPRYLLLCLFWCMVGGTSAVAGWNTDPLAGTPISVERFTQSSPALASDGQGGVIVGWYDGRRDLEIYAQRMSAQGEPQWQPNGIPISLTSERAFGPLLCPDGSGGAHVLWYDYRTGNEQVGWGLGLQKLNHTGQITHTSGATSVTAIGTRPCMIPDGSGGAFLSWMDATDSGGFISYLVRVQRVDASGNLLWGAHGVQVCQPTGNQWSPQLSLDETGGVFVTWFDHRDNSSTSTIVLQRLNASGQPLWSADGVELSNRSIMSDDPQLAPDGSGGVFVVWQTRNVLPSEEPNNNSLTAQRVRADGTALWQAGGKRLTSWYASDHVAMSDQAGGVLIAASGYVHPNGGYIGEWAQRLNADGVAQWTESGVRLTDAATIPFSLRAISDGQGGALAVWAQLRDYDRDLYMQRVLPDGTLAFGPHARALCTLDGDQDEPRLLLGASDRVFAVWSDDRSATSSSDIYGTYLSFLTHAHDWQLYE